MFTEQHKNNRYCICGVYKIAVVCVHNGNGVYAKYKNNRYCICGVYKIATECVQNKCIQISNRVYKTASFVQNNTKTKTIDILCVEGAKQQQSVYKTATVCTKQKKSHRCLCRVCTKHNIRFCSSAQIQAADITMPIFGANTDILFFSTSVSCCI